MKKISIMLCIAVVAIMTACGSGSKGYSPEICKELTEKIEKDEPLSEKDYDVMIDQMTSMAKIAHEMKQEMEADPSKAKEMSTDEKNVDMAKYMFGFAIYLGMHQNELSADNQKKLQKAQEEVTSLQK